MLYLAAINRENKSERPVFVAARNVHRAFVYASAELDADVVWLTSKDNLSPLQLQDFGGGFERNAVKAKS